MRTLLLLAILLASCASEPKSPYWVERERLLAKYNDKLTPSQRQQFRTQTYNSVDAAQSALNSYIQKNQLESQRLSEVNSRMREINDSWKTAQRFIDGVTAYFSQESKERSPARKSDLENDYIDAITSLKTSEQTILHTPFERGQKNYLLEQNGSYESRAKEAKKRLSEK